MDTSKDDFLLDMTAGEIAAADAVVAGMRRRPGDALALLLKHAVERAATSGLPARDGVPSGIAETARQIEAAYWEEHPDGPTGNREEARFCEALLEDVYRGRFDAHYQGGLSHVPPRPSEVA